MRHAHKVHLNETCTQGLFHLNETCFLCSQISKMSLIHFLLYQKGGGVVWDVAL